MLCLRVLAEKISSYHYLYMRSSTRVRRKSHHTLVSACVFPRACAEHFIIRVYLHACFRARAENISSHDSLCMRVPMRERRKIYHTIVSACLIPSACGTHFIIRFSMHARLRACACVQRQFYHTIVSACVSSRACGENFIIRLSLHACLHVRVVRISSHDCLDMRVSACVWRKFHHTIVSTYVSARASICCYARWGVGTTCALGGNRRAGR